MTKGHVRFYTILSLDPVLADRVRKRLESSAPYPYDFIYTFEVPAGPGSMKIDPTIQNPNGLTTHDAAYHPSYQRLTCLLRLSPSPRATAEQKNRMEAFIYAKAPYTNYFDVVLVDFGAPSRHPSSNLYSSYHLPPMIPPPINETAQYGKEFRRIRSLVRHKLWWSGYSTSSLRTRNSVLNIFAPLYRNLLTTTKPYLGGFQALQLAGNGQGDNYDAQYRLSQSGCLTDNNAMVALCTNHASFRNCAYNSINVIDSNKAYGYDGVVLDRTFPYRYYMVLIGRNVDFLQQVETRVRQGLGAMQNDVYFHKIFVRTGPTSQGDVPLCHRLLMVERTYLNTAFPSQTDPGTTYRLTDLFGDNLDGLRHDAPDEAWKSLSNVVAPQNETLLSPHYMMVSFSPQNVQRLFLCAVLVLFLLLLLAWFVRALVQRQK